MKNILPELSTRSYTPVSVKSKDLRSYRIKNSTVMTPSMQNTSLSPLRVSASRNSNEVTLSHRPISDEVKLVPLEQDPLIRRFNSMINDKPNSSNRLNQKIVLERVHNYYDVINALFTMYGFEKCRLSAFHMAQLFVALGYCDDCEILVDIFRSITEGQPFNLISFSKSELFKICDDSKTENILRSILRGMKKTGMNHTQNIQSLLNVIKKWWQKLDKSQNGFVSYEDICNFYGEIGAIETSSDSKRIFLKFGQFGNFKQFSSIFGKALLKYLLSELAILVKKGNQN